MKIFRLSAILLLAVLLFGCKKEEEPTPVVPDTSSNTSGTKIDINSDPGFVAETDNGNIEIVTGNYYHGYNNLYGGSDAQVGSIMAHFVYTPNPEPKTRFGLYLGMYDSYDITMKEFVEAKSYGFALDVDGDGVVIQYVDEKDIVYSSTYTTQPSSSSFEIKSIKSTSASTVEFYAEFNCVLANADGTKTITIKEAGYKGEFLDF